MQSAHDDIDFSGVLGAIRRGLPRILGVTALAAGLTYGALTLVPAKYKSTSQVILETPSSSLLRPSGQTGSSDPKIDEGEVASQAEVIRSRDLLTGVVANEHLDQIAEFNPSLRAQGLLGRLMGFFTPAIPGATDAERARNALEMNLKVGEVPKTRLINIDVTAHDPQLAAHLANAVAQAFLDRNRASQVKDANEATTSLGADIAEIKQQTEAAETALERFRAESGLLNGQNNVTLNNQQLSELNTQLTQAAAARTEAEARSRILHEMIAGGNVETSQEVVKSPNMQQLFQQKLRVERDIAELSATLLPGHPRMRQLAVELATAKVRLREEAKQVAIGMGDDLKVAAAREDALRSSIAQLTQNAARNSETQAKLSSLEREAQSKRNTYDGLLQRLSDASSRRNNASVSAMARLNESAVAATVPDSPKKTQMSIFAMLGAAVLGLVTVITRELLGGPARRAAPVAQSAARFTAKPGSTLRLANCAALAKTGACGRLLLTGEAQGQDLKATASELAAKLTSGPGGLILLDLLPSHINAASEPGLAELVAGVSTFETTVRTQAGGLWHRIGAGGTPDMDWMQGQNANLGLVFEALGAIYRTVLIVADRATATLLLEALEGQIDLGIITAAPGRGAGAPTEQGFLGYDVADLTIAWLEAPKHGPAAAAGRLGKPKLGAVPA